MKNLTFIFAFFLCAASVNCFAQPGGSLDSRAATVTRNMSAQMGLNEMEYIKLKALNQENIAKAAEINKLYANDVTLREVKINELQKQYEKNLADILNKKQLEAYAEYKENKNNFTAFSAEITD